MDKRLADILSRVKTRETWNGVLEPSILCRGQIPPPMWGMAPRVVLGQPWWVKTRREACLATGFHCLACGVHVTEAQGRKWLEGHEVYDVDWVLGRMIYLRTVPLCHYCHNYVHSGRLQNLLTAGLVPHAKYTAIIQHGDSVLDRAGLVRKEYRGPQAEWADWRLVVPNKEYAPLYDSLDDWRAAQTKEKL